MARYIDIDKLIAEYDRVHVGPAGGARKLMVEAPIADVVPKAEVAREIFEEIEQTCRVCGAFGVRGYIMDDVANLKKKYTEARNESKST